MEVLCVTGIRLEGTKLYYVYEVHIEIQTIKYKIVRMSTLKGRNLFDT